MKKVGIFFIVISGFIFLFYGLSQTDGKLLNNNYEEKEILLDNLVGMNIDEDKFIAMILKEIKQEKQERLTGVDDVKKKFKNAMEEYLERTQSNL